MNAKRSTLCLALLGVLLLLQLSVAQKPKAVQTEDEMATTVGTQEPEPLPASAAEPDDPPAVVVTSETTVPESSAESVAAPEAAIESAPAPTAAPQTDADPAPQTEAEPVPQAEAEPAPQAEAEPAPQTEAEADPAPQVQAEAEPEPTPASEATAAPEPMGEPPFVPSSDEPDYQNDEAPSHVDETPKMPAIEEPTMVPAETHSAKEPETSNQTPAKETTPTMSCFSCTSGQKGACSSNPREKITCPANSKGCFTLIKRDTKMVTRGCQSELTEEGTTYCHKEPKLCEMCSEILCNKQVVPLIGGATRISLGWTMLFWLVFGVLHLV